MRRVATWGVPVGVAVLAMLVAGRAAGDSSLFVLAGRTLLSAHWSHAFASKGVQAGPLQLALFGSIGRSAGALAIVLALATVLLLFTAGHALGVKSPLLIATLGLLAIGAGFTRVGAEVGHPADALLPLLWILAAVQAGRGRAVRAGLIVGLCAGVETWGILGLGVLALAPERRDAARGALVGGGVATLLFAPFLLGGHFAMGAYRWPVGSPSLLSFLLPYGTTFGWPFRLAQGAFALGAGIAVARPLRHSPHAPWVVVLAIVVARLLLDPLLLPYYLAAVQGPVFLGATFLAARVMVLRRVRRESFA